jgi:hypothetical protein
LLKRSFFEWYADVARSRQSEKNDLFLRSIFDNLYSMLRFFVPHASSQDCTVRLYQICTTSCIYSLQKYILFKVYQTHCMHLVGFPCVESCRTISSRGWADYQLPGAVNQCGVQILQQHVINSGMNVTQHTANSQTRVTGLCATHSHTIHTNSAFACISNRLHVHLLTRGIACI